MEDENKNEKLFPLRHTLAHIMMQALERLYGAIPGVGPAIDNGWYHDFEAQTKITETDLKKIKKEMIKIINQDFPLERQIMSVDDGIQFLNDKKYTYTAELAKDLKQKGEKEISFYTQGEFTNMCRGPHISSTGQINPKAFKLTKIAGAYWKSDEKRPMLQRIYGVAFETSEELAEYEKMIEEAKKRDHRKLGKELDLFTFSPLVGSGLPLFTPKGTAVREAITDYIAHLQEKFGWQRVTTPHLTKKELYETSGHWAKFGDELFKVNGKGNSEFVMKPMNCPHHTQIYSSLPRSYKDLPLRYGENGVVYRDEQAGELLGLARVRHITQDDGHAFCTPDQIETEIKNIISIIKDFYNSLGMLRDGNYWVSLSLSDPDKPEKYMINDDGLFLKAEKILEKIATDEKLPFKKMTGEAAFYGPKLDFQFKDSLGREWQLGTVQLDFSMPKRFGLEYTDKNGEKQTPIMIHRAIAGSLERFMAVMIEDTAGAFPFWLAPVQVKIIPVAEEHQTYAKNIFDKLKENKIRVEFDDSHNSFGKKIREAKKTKLPYFIIIGSQDVEAEKLTLESRDGNSQQISLEELLEKLKKESK